MGLISVILPVVADAGRLDRTVLHTQYEAGLWPTEIIVANTVGESAARKVQSLDVNLIECSSDDRSEALNCGAKAAKGEVLLFLAADSLVPRRFAESIWWALRDPRVVGGAFDFEFDPYPYTHGATHNALDAVHLLNRIRFRWTGNFVIEQGIFVRREVFDKIGGFQRVQKLEDLYFSRAMKRRGRTAVLGPPMLASPRRFLRNGVIKQFVSDLLMLAFDGLGAKPRRPRGQNSQNKPQLPTLSEVVKGEGLPGNGH